MTWQSKTPKQSFRGCSLLHLALNGYTQIQIEKILFPIMNFRFSPCLEFLPCSQSFGKGTPFQKPQSVRYPAWMPYRNSLCSACNKKPLVFGQWQFIRRTLFERLSIFQIEGATHVVWLQIIYTCIQSIYIKSQNYVLRTVLEIFSYS